MTLEHVPALVLVPNQKAGRAFTVSLPLGAEAGSQLDDTQPWAMALGCIDRAARDKTGLDLGGVGRVEQRELVSGGLCQTIQGALAALGG